MSATRTEACGHGAGNECAPERAVPCYNPRCEHSVPLLWPFAAAIELGEQGLKLFERNLNLLSGAQKIVVPPQPEGATANRVLLDLDTMRLRDFGPRESDDFPVLVDAP